MLLGIEIEKRQVENKTYWRIAPKVVASYRMQQAIYGVGFIILFAAVIGAFSLLLAHPDPILKPDQTVSLWGGR